MSRKEAQKFAADVKKLRKTAIDLGNKIKDFLINIFNKMITVVIKVSKFIVAHRKEIAKLIQFLVKLVTGITKSITAFVMLGTKATNAGSAIVKFLIRYIKDTITALKVLGSAAISAGGKLISGIVNKAKSVSSALKSLKNTASNVFNSIKTAIGGAISKLGSLISKIGSVISKIKSIVFPSPPSWLPGFAKGVTNFSGGLAVVGEKGPEI
ncbi:hypothetical protein, partial [Sulfurimonas sp.]|uniref:hypothetical protein n=1 Tax=Sulfurimonas sp. TaxID=2022749 RepID=UPI003D0FE583